MGRRAKEPLKREGGQTVQDMTQQLLADKESGTRGRARLYNEVSQEQKAQALDVAIAQQQELLNRVEHRGRVNLNDLTAVKAAVSDYIQSCRNAGVYPSMTALAPSMGYSRQALYLYMSQHDTETTKYLDMVRSAMSAIVQQAGLTRVVDNAMAIFVLKNSAGMSDKLDVNATAIPGTLDDGHMTAEEIAKRYLGESSADSAATDIAGRYTQEDSDQWP